MIRFKINGAHQRREADAIAERVPHVMVRATFVQMPDEQADQFAHELAYELGVTRERGDRGRLNALHSIRRHFEAQR